MSIMGRKRTMNHSVVPPSGVTPPKVASQVEHATFQPLNLRGRSILIGILAAALLTLLIALGSRGFHWFDAALIGYAVATIFATAAVSYKYAFWLFRPPTGRYWQQSWRLFLFYENFRRYTVLISTGLITEL